MGIDVHVLRPLASLYAVLSLLDVAYRDGGGEPRYLRVKRVTDPCELNLFVLDAHYALGTPATNAAEDDRTVEGDASTRTASYILCATPKR